MKEIVKLNRVRLELEDRLILSDINATIRSGDVIGLIGLTRKLWLKEDNVMKINMVIFLTSSKEQIESNRTEIVMKTFESTIRPVIGDIIDDPGFDSRFHNG